MDFLYLRIDCLVLNILFLVNINCERLRIVESKYDVFICVRSVIGSKWCVFYIKKLNINLGKVKEG